MFDNLFLFKQNNISGLSDEAKSIYVANVFKKEQKTIVFVTNTLYEASNFLERINNYEKDALLFPMDDFLTSEALAISPDLKTTRLETLEALSEPKIVVTNLMGYLRYLPPKNLFEKKNIKLKINDEIKISELLTNLYDLGYTRETTVNKTGELALRGYVLDIFPVNSENPIRIMWWGDTITDIKAFDVDSQLTTDSLKQVLIKSNTEFLIDEPTDSFGLTQKDLINYLKPVNISHYNEDTIVIFNEYNNLLKEYKLLMEEVLQYNTSKNLYNKKYMFTWEETINKDERYLSLFHSKDSYNVEIKKIDPFRPQIDQIKIRLNEYLKNHKMVIICLSDLYQANKLIDELEDNKVILTNEKELFENKINLVIKKITDGFEYENNVYISSNEIFNIREENHIYKTNFKLGSKIRDINKLSIGDYVVHYAHGIGRYCGLKTLTKNGLEKDYLMVEYKDKDHLYIPVEKIELIMKYTDKDGKRPSLSKLGGTEWQKIKQRAQTRAKGIAGELLLLYAKREMTKGFEFGLDSAEQEIFETEFNYQLTPDQKKAIADIKKDMEKGRAMDRLLCGDVGYGKTEVAFRAIFKAIMAGKQTALLCPTTILSSQHYENAVNRFKTFPIDIALINRFTPPKKVKDILDKLKKGQIDLLIGTHRLLSKDIIFKNLGLLIVDEEQRFGVKHKEMIKEYRNNIDVLTLSATPIPRTLKMSLAGIKDLSLIETPPLNRYPIQTYVLEENMQIIKDAIYKELARKGQVFILYNNIAKMDNKLSEIKALVKEARVTFAHGRMSKNELEKVMFDFTEQKYDVLLCTTIIETGIDIPTVNTLIIIDADHFGLSQLYQIRGRVGRSDKIAYCYLMYNQDKVLNEEAVKRLEAIKEFTELGSSFSIAMRDLSIRGAGDILGKEQAGFVDSVGIEMFIRMIEQEIKKIKGEEVIKDEEVEPVIEVTTAINNNYILDEDLKIEIHKKINTIDSYDKLLEVKKELEDRFGPINEEISVYMHEEWLSKLVSKFKVLRINQMKNMIEIIIDKDYKNNLNGEYLFTHVLKLSSKFRFKTRGNYLVITLDIRNLDKHFVYYLLDLLEIIEKSIKK